MKLKLGYFGTPDFSANTLKMILEELSDTIEVILVVTQPDKAVGRKKIVTPSPVKTLAVKNNIDVMHDVTPKNLKNLDLVLTFAYGRMINSDLLSSPKHGFWNIHPSLLPKYRGASPITYPMLLGDKKTGVTLIKMDSGMDTGPIISQAELHLSSTSIQAELRDELVDIGFGLFKWAISSGLDSIDFDEQDNSQATNTRLLTKNDGFIELETIKNALNNEQITPQHIPSIIQDYYEENKLTIEDFSTDAKHIIWNMYRALTPWPGVWTKVMIGDTEKRLKITRIAFNDNVLSLKKVQLEGKNEVDFSQFNDAYKIF